MSWHTSETIVSPRNFGLNRTCRYLFSCSQMSHSSREIFERAYDRVPQGDKQTCARALFVQNSLKADSFIPSATHRVQHHNILYESTDELQPYGSSVLMYRPIFPI